MVADKTDRDFRAIVRPSMAVERFNLERFAPAPPLDRFVDRFWKTAWDIVEPFVQTVVTFPVVNLVVQADGSAIVSGVQLRNDDRRLEGSGWALGAMFRPGGFRPFVSMPVTALTDKRFDAADVFGPEAETLSAAVVSAGSDDERVALISDFLIARMPDETTIGEDLAELVEHAVAVEPPITRVDELANRYGVSVRTLQRLFAEHIGLGPKQLLDRYRVQAAAEAARRPVRSWADVAHQLGYADQAHLTADLSEHYGSPPATYARAENAEPSASTSERGGRLAPGSADDQ